MGYSNRTRFYSIPVIATGEIMTQQYELHQMNIIDGLLYATAFGCEKCLIEQGEYEFKKAYGFANFTLKPHDENSYSIMGIINKRLFYSKQPIQFLNLTPTRDYYFYIEYKEDLQVNPTYFNIVHYEKQQEQNACRMPLCVIYFTDYEKGYIDTDVNKIYAKNILSHVMDNTDPHGEVLFQKVLNVKKELFIDSQSVYASIYDSFITTGNEYVYDFPQGKEVIFVTVYPQHISAGNISWKINNNQIIFNNSGQAGVKINFKMDVK